LLSVNLVEPVSHTLKSYLKEKSTLIDKQLESLIPNDDTACKELYLAARYALLNGGKRIRPIITLAVTEALGAPASLALTPACALEMIHCYSLIHDDLPCMDDDDFRRGQPTVHKVYNEAHAVLTGDYLLTYSFEVITQSPDLTAEQKLELISTLTMRCAGKGLIGGQVMDIQAVGKQLTLNELKEIHRAKTGALLLASIEFGAIIGGATDSERSALNTFGENIGLAFQVIDDVIDVVDSESKHGTAISSDVMNDKSTYATILGVDKAKLYAEELVDCAKKALKIIDKDTSQLERLGSFIVNRTF